MKNLIRKINEMDTFSPYFFFPFVLIAYFMVSLFDFGRVEYFEVKKSVALPILVGLVSYLLAVYFVQKKNWTFPTFGLTFLKGKTIYFLYLLGIIGLIAYLIMIFTGQVGITDESVRRNLDPKLYFLSSFLWFAVIFLICYKIIKEKELTRNRQWTYLVILLVIFALFVLMGYRTPILVMFFTSFIVFHYIIKKIKVTWMLTALLILGVSFSLFGLFRIVTEDVTKDFNTREGPDVELSEKEMDEDKILARKINSTPKWLRAMTSESVTGKIVLAKLMEYTDEHGYLYGRLHAGIFTTVLPGEQLSPRAEVTEMVNSLSVQEGKYVTRPGRTTTPTLLGQFYVEAGYIAIMIGFALFGVILSMLYNQMQRTGTKSYQTIAYSFVTTIFILAIHTGLLDLVFLLMIAYAIVSTSIEQTRLKAPS